MDSLIEADGPLSPLSPFGDSFCGRAQRLGSDAIEAAPAVPTAKVDGRSNVICSDLLGVICTEQHDADADKPCDL